MGPNLEKILEEAGFYLSAAIIKKFCRYYELLREWNQKFNLTSLIEPEDYIYKHVLDSLFPIKYLSFADGALVDVGAGAGFPGLPLKLAEPTLNLTLVEATAKKAAFLKHCCQELGVEAKVLAQRSEVLGRGPLRNAFTLATTRGVGALPVINEYCLPLLASGGRHLALRGPAGKEEAMAAAPALATLGGRLEAVYSYQLPTGAERTLVVVEKVKATPARFLRRPGIPRKRPL